MVAIMADVMSSPPPQFQLYKDKDKSILYLITTFTLKDFPFKIPKTKFKSLAAAESFSTTRSSWDCNVRLTKKQND
jgi:hypothetical protein